MIRWFSRPMLDATRLFALFGDNSSETDGDPGVLISQANVWLPRPIDLIAFNHRRPSATGAGNSFQIRFNDGTSQLDTFDFANADGTSKTTDYTGKTFGAGTGADPADGSVLRHVQTLTASAAGRSAMVYQDNAGVDGLSYHAAGDGSFNMGVGATPLFVGVGSGGNLATSVESVSQCVWPATGTLSNFIIRYLTGATTTYDVNLRIGGSNIRQITGATLPASTGGSLTTIDTTAVSVTADDLVNFHVARASGSNSQFTACIMFTFTE